MSFLIYPLIFFIFPYCATSSHTYGIIRNATIKLPFTISTNDDHKSTLTNCSDCLCEAYRRQSDNISLFTCTQNTLNVTCQFYYFMPKRDEIRLSQNTSIYLMKNETFEEKADCCNTTYLVQEINKTSSEPIFTGNLSFLIFGHNNTIVTSSSETLYGIDRLRFQLVNISNISASFKTGAYSDGKYYFSQNSTITVYEKTLTSIVHTIVKTYGMINVIRFLNETQMLLGAGSGGVGFGVYICEKNNTTEHFNNCILINETYGSEQVHALGVVNNDTFYVGWDTANKSLHFYTRGPNNSWVHNTNRTIKHDEHTTDIVVDRCNRIWTVNAYQNEIFIYDQDKSVRNNIIVHNQAFNLLILEDYNYTVITSHLNDVGSHYIKTSVNCRPVRTKDNRYLFV